MRDWDAFIAWLIDKYGGINAQSIIYEITRGLEEYPPDPARLESNEFYQAFLAEQPETPQRQEDVPPAEREGAEPRAGQPPTMVAIRVPEQVYGGVIEWSDGTFTDALEPFKPISGEDAQSLIDFYGVGLEAPEGIDRERLEQTIREFENLSEQEKQYLALMLRPWEELTFAEQARFDLDRDRFEQEAEQWEAEFARLQGLDELGQQQWAAEMTQRALEFGTLSAWQESQIGLSEQQIDQQRFEFGNLSAWQQAQMEMMMRQWGELSASEQAQFNFDREQFEWEKQRITFEFENLSAQQESQRELGLRGLGLQERIAQTEINKSPMDWMAAWNWSNPTWSGEPRGTPNPEAIPYHEIPVGGFPPSGGR
ncbi:hypothetical protein LCGC14_0396670 [marine sediment metagenome]|uniref:Uncharacterized protein n=1 Tax=marine sediment metagenome TaxID=412755 RepID=A0A0F9SY77_9ZZZZ